MAATVTSSVATTSTEEQRVVLYDISWEHSRRQGRNVDPIARAT